MISDTDPTRKLRIHACAVFAANWVQTSSGPPLAILSKIPAKLELFTHESKASN